MGAACCAAWHAGAAIVAAIFSGKCRRMDDANWRGRGCTGTAGRLRERRRSRDLHESCAAARAMMQLPVASSRVHSCRVPLPVLGTTRGVSEVGPGSAWLSGRAGGAAKVSMPAGFVIAEGCVAEGHRFLSPLGLTAFLNGTNASASDGCTEPTR